MEKGSLLRRSGVSFRSAAEKSLIENSSDGCTPRLRKTTRNIPGPTKPTKYKNKAEKYQLEMKKGRKSKKTKSLSIAKTKIWYEQKNRRNIE